MLGRQAIFMILFGVSAGLVAGIQPAAAGERLSLPFTCSVDGGNVRLAPASEQTLAVVGARQERVVLACAEGRPVQCRTMIAHNFAVMCGGERVSWMRVAEAIGGRRTSRVWREGEQLNIALRENDPEGAVASAAPCKPQQPDAVETDAVPDSDPFMERAVAKPCKTPAARELHFVLPAGYAPVSHFGARIVTQAAMTTAAPIAEAKVARAPVLAAAARSDAAAPATHHRLLERTILSEPLPEIDSITGLREEAARDNQDWQSSEGSSAAERFPRAGEGMPTDAAGGGAPVAGKHQVTVGDSAKRIRSAWSVTVTPTGTGSSSEVGDAATFSAALAEQTSTTQRDVMLWLVLTSLFVTTGWIVWSRPEQFAVLARRVSGNAVGRLPENAPLVRHATGLLRRASSAFTSLRPGHQEAGRSGGVFPAAGLEAAYGAVSGVVGALPPDLPLRSVLEDEMQRVRQRLAVAKAASADGQISAAAYRVLMRDLERIRRIGESARDTVSANARSGGGAASGSGQVPRNRAEALQLLGLNANVSEATVKKCVDALRMSWHPDLAHDAADLALREERIKQINIAMELISGKPQQD